MTVERFGRAARSGAGAAGSHVAPDRAARTKPLHIVAADVQAEDREMGAETAKTIRQPRMTQEVKERRFAP